MPKASVKKVSEAAILRRVKLACLTFGLVMIRMSFRPGVAAGWPDVLVLGPGGNSLFVETKAPGKLLRPIQKVRARALVDFEHGFCKLDSVEEVDAALRRFAAACDGAEGNR
ncbi:MAG: VRR-NUC domain-containing protein [Tepidisphaeraceae bacterium]